MFTVCSIYFALLNTDEWHEIIYEPFDVCELLMFLQLVE